ncbi:MAG TPA: protein kinase, partial [Vicinamibacterales bacterium]|nr:protein kinase [Vicinamibacterales bacterium]
MIGTALGPYRVLEKLGEGGMGEVYRARDTRLDRDVAVKVLPPHLSTDPEALARFEREAKSIAALSHPNILAIHDVGTADGVAYVVTELLEGESLRERLAGGALPPKKIIQIASDIAQGLAAAHGKGLVHRDLKPENVFLSQDGHVKILDFGLAKQVTGRGDASQASKTASDAATALVTEAGMVMGTVGYMAPEQVKGQPADPRSDIFALGCVLYEMAAGQKAFSRETAAETMTAILREEPDDLAIDSGRLSPAFLEIVRHCLEKRPEERFQSARDLAFALQAVGGSAITSGRMAVRDEAGPRRAPRWMVPAALLAVGIVAFIVGRGTAGGPAEQGAITAFEQVTDAPGVETMPTVSPDGQTIVYVVEAGGSSDIYALRTGSRRPTLLTPNSPGPDLTPAFSPDGERIAFASGRDGGGIFLMSATGESVRRVSDVGNDPAWSPDGRELVVANAAFAYPTDRAESNVGLTIIDVESGAKRPLAVSLDAVQPSWSPDGRRIAFWGLRGRSGQRDIWTIAADGSDANAGGRSVTDDPALDWSPVWSPDGRYLYFASNRGGTMNLWRVPIDQSSGEVLGEAQPMTTPALWSGQFSITRDGSAIVYASLNWRSTLMRAPFDPVRGELTGPPVILRRGTRPIRDHELSPDGQWVAITEAGAQEDLFLLRVDGSEYRRLTDDEARDRAPVWSPDGQRIAFYSDRGGTYQLWTARPDGSDFVQLIDLARSTNFPSWSPDGTRLAVTFLGAEWGIASADQKMAPELDVRTAPPGKAFWALAWSPDGRLIAGGLGSGEGTSPAVYDLTTREYTTLAGLSTQFVVPAWIDNDRLIVRDESGIYFQDL